MTDLADEIMAEVRRRAALYRPVNNIRVMLTFNGHRAVHRLEPEEAACWRRAYRATFGPRKALAMELMAELGADRITVDLDGERWCWTSEGERRWWDS